MSIGGMKCDCNEWNGPMKSIVMYKEIEYFAFKITKTRNTQLNRVHRFQRWKVAICNQNDCAKRKFHQLYWPISIQRRRRKKITSQMTNQFLPNNNWNYVLSTIMKIFAMQMNMCVRVHEQAFMLNAPCIFRVASIQYFFI